MIDRSGSMNGEKIQQVKAAAFQVVEGLGDGETFNIIDYSDYLSSFATRPVVKNRANIAAARDYIRRLAADGGTNLHDALAEALRPEPGEGMLPIVLFLTDGLPTVGICNEAVIRSDAEKLNVHHRRIFTFGVGYDVNAPLLNHLAQKSRATSSFVLPSEDIEAKVSQMFRRLSGPAISDPVLTAVEDGERRRVIDTLPAVLPDLFEGDQLVVLGKYQGDAPLRFRLDGRFHGKPRSLTFSFKLDRATAKNGFVPRLWASRKIAALVEEIRQSGADPRPAAAINQARSDPRLKELVDEIVKLSVEFGVLTEYTAFIDKQGTDLSARNAVLRQATENVVLRAQNAAQRHGRGEPAYERQRLHVANQFELPQRLFRPEHEPRGNEQRPASRQRGLFPAGKHVDRQRRSQQRVHRPGRQRRPPGHARVRTPDRGSGGQEPSGSAFALRRYPVAG